MTTQTFYEKLENMNQDELVKLIFNMEDHLLNVIDDDSYVNEAGDILPINEQPDHVANIMELIDF